MRVRRPHPDRASLGGLDGRGPPQRAAMMHEAHSPRWVRALVALAALMVASWISALFAGSGR
jgi:hypothetical protein